ncbi:hypothetical protein J7384_01655 [Endozoicomonas sp. G2_1]|uniref:hypothetical protein n=1 Tax=Endozoicomonas sp. G2_1 TaxID=2821091 RepID=UPI001ADBFA03|nr:hypothetical protein [Endozoicomonas sp. G2_1]MBO9489058.1 hypothetical protein [Endozoicomonas sp. G2_1]
MSTPNSYWLWPKVEVNSSQISQSQQHLANIEAFFTEYYSPFEVVYFARARLAINAILSIEGASRPDLTFCQPYSSHCVLSAIAETSTPTTTECQKSKHQVIYHQWGQKTQVTKHDYHSVLIEDAVDSILTTNQPRELFPNNAPYCLVSLPKIMPVAIGAIVICQSTDQKQALLEYRDRSTLSLGIKKLENLTEFINITQFQESIFKMHPTLIPFVNDIEQAFFESVQKVKANLCYLSDCPTLENAITSYLASMNLRLPSNIIIGSDESVAASVYADIPITVEESIRTYYDYQTQSCRKVFLLPCHNQVEFK